MKGSTTMATKAKQKHADVIIDDPRHADNGNLRVVEQVRGGAIMAVDVVNAYEVSGCSISAADVQSAIQAQLQTVKDDIFAKCEGTARIRGYNPRHADKGNRK